MRRNESGLIIRSIRMRVGITQREMSAVLGHSANQVYNWETGKAAISYEKLIEIIDFYSLDISTERKRVRDEVNK